MFRDKEPVSPTVTDNITIGLIEGIREEIIFPF